VTDPAVLLAHMTERLETVRSARFRVILEYYDRETRGANFRAAVLVRQPEDLHVQLLSPFGDPLRTLVSNGRRLSMYDLEAQTYYYGSPTPENVARILPFYLTAADIARVLLAGPPLDLMHTDPAELSLDWDGERGAYRLSGPMAHEPGRLDLWVRHGDWTLQWAQRHDARGGLVFELRTGGFETVDGAGLPTRIRFLYEAPDRSVDMSISVERTELNVDFNDALFELEAPHGVRQVALDP
jgi:outer membrane lipoprotein-sorting protein